MSRQGVLWRWLWQRPLPLTSIGEGNSSCFGIVQYLLIFRSPQNIQQRPSLRIILGQKAWRWLLSALKLTLLKGLAAKYRDLFETTSRSSSKFSSKLSCSYAVEDICAEFGVAVIRLPPFHCFFNPIEMCWSQMKAHLNILGKPGDSLETVTDW